MVLLLDDVFNCSTSVEASGTAESFGSVLPLHQYDEVKRLETDIAYMFRDGKRGIPAGIYLHNGLRIPYAWGNFDVCTEHGNSKLKNHSTFLQWGYFIRTNCHHIHPHK